MKELNTIPDIVRNPKTLDELMSNIDKSLAANGITPNQIKENLAKHKNEIQNKQHEVYNVDFVSKLIKELQTRKNNS